MLARRRCCCCHHVGAACVSRSVRADSADSTGSLASLSPACKPVSPAAVCGATAVNRPRPAELASANRHGDASSCFLPFTRRKRRHGRGRAAGLVSHRSATSTAYIYSFYSFYTPGATRLQFRVYPGYVPLTRVYELLVKPYSDVLLFNLIIAQMGCVQEVLDWYKRNLTLMLHLTLYVEKKDNNLHKYVV